MASSQSSSGELVASINVTPLVDIMMVLLVVFLVTAKLMVAQTIPVDLPKAASGGEQQSVLAVALVAVWALTMDISLDPAGWASRVVPLLLLGVLLGEATDRMRRTEDDRRALVSAALLHREAIEINDSLVQGIAAAKWALEAGNDEASLKTLDDTLARAHDLVSDLIRRADMGGRAEALPGGASLPARP